MPIAPTGCVGVAANEAHASNAWASRFSAFDFAAAVAATTRGYPAGAQFSACCFELAWHPGKIPPRLAQYAAMVASGSGRPDQGRAGASSLEETEATQRAGLLRTANPAAVAWLAKGWFFRCVAVQFKADFVHPYMMRYCPWGLQGRVLVGGL